jgi:hypothetical protein
MFVLPQLGAYSCQCSIGYYPATYSNERYSNWYSWNTGGKDGELLLHGEDGNRVEDPFSRNLTSPKDAGPEGVAYKGTYTNMPVCVDINACELRNPCRSSFNASLGIGVADYGTADDWLALASGYNVTHQCFDKAGGYDCLCAPGFEKNESIPVGSSLTWNREQGDG